MQTCLFHYAFTHSKAYQGILPHLSPKDAANLARTAREVNAAVKNHFETVTKSCNESFKSIGFVASDHKNHHQNLCDFKTSLKTKILAYPDSEKPSEIVEIVNSESHLTPEQATQLTAFIQARDTLVVWRVIASSIQAEEDFSNAFASFNATVEKAKG